MSARTGGALRDKVALVERQKCFSFFEAAGSFRDCEFNLRGDASRRAGLMMYLAFPWWCLTYKLTGLLWRAGVWARLL